MAKIDTLFMPKTAKNHTLSVLWGRTLHSSYKRGPPGSCSTLSAIKPPVPLFCGLLKDPWSFAFSACFQSNFYNNCLISRALIGSYLSSVGPQTDIIVKLNFQLSNRQLFNQWDFMDFFKSPIKKREKLLTMFASLWINHLSCRGKGCCYSSW